MPEDLQWVGKLLFYSLELQTVVEVAASLIRLFQYPSQAVGRITFKEICLFIFQGDVSRQLLKLNPRFGSSFRVWNFSEAFKKRNGEIFYQIRPRKS